MISLSNERFNVTFNEVGAELTSFFDSESGTEFIWQADPAYWGRHAPVLFPIVGRLKNDEYIYNGTTYNMSQHGFARDKKFEVVSQTEDNVVFLLSSDNETKTIYPFDFELFISYSLIEGNLTVKYRVKNIGSSTMFFSIGGHPAFNVPLEKDLAFDDYFIHFSPMKSRIELPLSGNYIDTSKRTLGQTNTDFQLTHSLFKHDAIIYETKGHNSYTIKSEKGIRSVSLSYETMPYVGIWSPYPKEAPFICIEPWCGIADTLQSNKNLEDKYGINALHPNEEFNQSYIISVN